MPKPSLPLAHMKADACDRSASTLMMKGMTAQYLLRRTCKVEPGDTILIHAAAGNSDRAEALLTEALQLSPNFDPLLPDRARRALVGLATGASS